MLYEPTRESLSTHPVPSWFRAAKLGIFVHWGVYSVPAWAPKDPLLLEWIGAPEEQRAEVLDRLREDLGRNPVARTPYAEWYQNSMSVPGSPTAIHHQQVWGGRPYEDFAGMFTEAASRWEAADWAELFQRAGARYVVLTTKHHDGYLLWPSRHPNPHRDAWASERDLVGELTSAARAKGMKMGLYYSGGLDWTFGGLPMRQIGEVGKAIPRSEAYAAYVDAHFRELIDRYEPSILWNDIASPDALDRERLFADFYNRIPDGVVNDRFRSAGEARAPLSDFRTPEYGTMADLTPFVWESCRGLGYSFGLNRAETDEDLISLPELIRLFVDIVSKNGNLLLDVGPEADGSIPEIQVSRLLGLGRWLEVNGEGIYGTSPWTVSSGSTSDGGEVRYTAVADELFAFLLSPSTTGRVEILGLDPDPSTCVELLGSGPVPWHATAHGLSLEVGNLSEETVHALRISPAPRRRAGTDD